MKSTHHLPEVCPAHPSLSKLPRGFAQPSHPLQRVEEATSLNARILHTLVPSTLPACPPLEEGIIKQTSQPPTICAGYLYTQVLLEMGARHPGSQEKSSLTQNANGRPSARTDPPLCASLRPPPRSRPRLCSKRGVRLRNRYSCPPGNVPAEEASPH